MAKRGTADSPEILSRRGFLRKLGAVMAGAAGVGAGLQVQQKNTADNRYGSSPYGGSKK